MSTNNNDACTMCEQCMWGDSCDRIAADECRDFDPLWTDVPVDRYGTAKDRALFYADWNRYIEYIENGEKEIIIK